MASVSKLSYGTAGKLEDLREATSGGLLSYKMLLLEDITSGVESCFACTQRFCD